MESIHFSSPSLLPIPSFLTNQHPTKGRTQLYFLTKQRVLLPSLSPPLRPQAVDTALSVAAAPATGGGDISVLIQVSAVLLLMYWISNFVIPEIVIKNMEKKAEEEEEEEKVSGQEANASSDTDTANEPEKPKKKFKKEDIKKMFSRR